MDWKRRAIYAAICLALILLIGWGAMAAVPPIPKLFSWQDKVEHFLAFGGLSLWLTVLTGPKRWAIAVCLAAFMAIGLETAQALFLHSRTGSLDDVFASFLGILAGSGFILWARRTFRPVLKRKTENCLCPS